jgi:hypothetical protein
LSAKNLPHELVKMLKRGFNSTKQSLITCYEV